MADHKIAESTIYQKPDGKSYVGRTPPADSRLIYRSGERVSKTMMKRLGLRSLKEQKSTKGTKK